MMQPLNRRTFLRAAGVALALPMLDAMQPKARAAEAARAVPRRMVAIETNMGIMPQFFFPEKDGKDYALSPYLDRLKAHKANMTVFSGVSLPGVTGENLVRQLEMRLDNVVHKMGFGDSLAQARQFINHGHITLNARKTNVASAATKPGDVIGWSARGRKTEAFKYAQENMANKTIPSWLNVDATTMTGRVLSAPAAGETVSQFDPAVIVEFYSR